MNRLLACPVPTNVNPLSPNGFMFSLARIPELSYFCQEVALPTVTLPTVDIGTPFVHHPVPGDAVEFSELSVQFLVDAEMSNYRALFKWLSGLGFPENNQQYLAEINSEFPMSENASASSDATLTILGNTNRPIQTVEFKDCVITSLNSLLFTSSSSDVQYLVGNATFRYTLYKFID